MGPWTELPSTRVRIVTKVSFCVHDPFLHTDPMILVYQSHFIDEEPQQALGRPRQSAGQQGLGVRDGHTRRRLLREGQRSALG